MNALYSARKNYVAAENSEKIRRALRHQVRTYADENYENGEQVYFKRKNYKGWKGPSVVLGKDGQTVIVKYGGRIYRVHPSQLMKTEDCREEKSSKNDAKRGINPDIKTSKTSKKDKNGTDSYRNSTWKKPRVAFKGGRVEELEEPDSTDSEISTSDVSEDEDFTDNDDDSDDNDSGSDHTELRETSDSESEDNRCESGESKLEEKATTQFEETVDEVVKRMTRLSVDEGLDIWKDDEELVMPRSFSKPKANTCIKFEIEGRCNQARVLSKQPKRTGVNKNSVNVIIDGDQKPSSINLDQVTEWEEIESEENVVYLSTTAEFDQDVVDAKEKELQKLKGNNVFEEVKFSGQSVISSKWVITEKFKEQKRVLKARLVARGFEEDSSKLRTDSPTCSRQNFRLVLIIAASKS